MPSSKKSIYGRAFMPWIVCLIAAVFYSYDFLLRVQPSVMIHPLMQFYGTNAAGIGLLSAFYYYAYTPLQIPAGLLLDKYSTRLVLTISALLCALGAYLFATMNVYTLALIARALMGIGSAFAFVGALKLGARWISQKNYALFVGIASGLGTVGAIFTDTILSGMVVHLGWQEAVLITAYIGLAIAILIALVVRDKPNHVEEPITREFRNWSHTFYRLKLIFKNGRFWINGLVGGLLFIPVNVFASLWGVGFLKHAYALTNHHAAIATSLIFFGSAVGGPLAGWMSDLIKKRKTLLFVGAIGSLLLTLTILFENNISNLTLYILLTLLGIFIGAQILVFSIAREISPPRSTATSSASTNFLVTMGAAVFQPLIGYLLVKYWDGSFQAPGIPFYSLTNYRDALLLVPAALAIAFVLIFFLPETNCELQHKVLKKPH